MKHLEGIGSEISTSRSKGGLVLLAIYFYVTYIFAAIFYIEDRDRIVTPNDTNPTTGNNTLCGTLTGCYLTMLRLTLYDGTGIGPCAAGFQIGADLSLDDSFMTRNLGISEAR